MKRFTFTILVILITDIILLVLCETFYNYGIPVVKHLNIIVQVIPILLLIMGFSCFNKKCLEFWNKKIYFNK